jgi:hypothetical protein
VFFPDPKKANPPRYFEVFFPDPKKSNPPRDFEVFFPDPNITQSPNSTRDPIEQLLGSNFRPLPKCPIEQLPGPKSNITRL